MKGLIILLAGILSLLLGGLGSGGEERISASGSSLMIEQAQQSEQISGTWHGFPYGLLLQINNDGSAQFGLDTDGTPIGYSAMMWFEDQQLSVLFTNYDGPNETCRSAVGFYTVQLHQGGAIRFETVHDECRFRQEILSGLSERGLLYPPFQN